MVVSTQGWREKLSGDEWEIIRKAISIAGRVTDSSSGRPLTGVVVQATSAAVRCWVKTSMRGHFHFVDVPKGEYVLEAFLPAGGWEHRKAAIEATVYREVEGRIQEEDTRRAEKTPGCPENDVTFQNAAHLRLNIQ